MIFTIFLKVKGILISINSLKKDENECNILEVNFLASRLYIKRNILTMKIPTPTKRKLWIRQLKYDEEKDVTSPSGAKESIMPLTNSKGINEVPIRVNPKMAKKEYCPQIYFDMFRC